MKLLRISSRKNSGSKLRARMGQFTEVKGILAFGFPLYCEYVFFVL